MSVIKVKNNGKWETIPIIGSTSGSVVGKIDSNSDGTGEIFNDYENNSALGAYSHVEGSNNVSYQTNSHAEGNNGIAFGNAAHVEGLGDISSYNINITSINVPNSTISYALDNDYIYCRTNDILKFSNNSRLYTVISNNADGREIKLDTTTGITTGNTTLLIYRHYAKGPGSHVEGKNTLALGSYAHAEGEKTIAKGMSSHAGGYNTEAIGIGSFTSGYAYESEYGDTIISAKGACSIAGGYVSDDLGVYANGVASLAFGYVIQGGSIEANGIGSIAIGYGASFPMQANGTGSVAFNTGTISDNYAQTSIGVLNTEDSNPSPLSYNSEKVAFVIGNGTNYNARGDAFKVLFNGQTYADGAYSGSGADYAEFFEWQDGNTDNEDRVGLFVSLDGDRIIKANSNSSYILGVVSGNPTIIGDNPTRWKNKYLTDEWGRPIYEDVEVKYTETEVDENGETSRVEKTRIDHVMKINPEWDSSLEYKSREVRPEWSAIGMMGKLLVKQDGTLNAGEFCYPNAYGIATKSESGYYVMKVISENLALILFK